jgi:RNA polymerase sigma-32 factor
MKPTKSRSTSSRKSFKGFKAVEGEVVEPVQTSSTSSGLDKQTDSDYDLNHSQRDDSDLSSNADNDRDIPKDINLGKQKLNYEIDEGDSQKALTATDPVTRYMMEIGRYPLLTREQEHELAIRYHTTGDSKAAEQLVTANLRFVVKVAAEYSKFGARLIDLVQEGNVGLMHAVKEFNPYKGVRLITYAVWWIRGYIQEYLMRQYSMVRIGTTATQRKLFYQLQKEREKLEREGVDNGIAQLSGKLGISQDEVQDMHSRLSGRDISLDAPVSEDGSARLIDLQSVVDPAQMDEELAHREELQKLIHTIEELRPSLNEREQFLLDARLLSDEPLTLQEIGDKYGTTREAVRQMEARLVQKIRKSIEVE